MRSRMFAAVLSVAVAMALVVLGPSPARADGDALAGAIIGAGVGHIVGGDDGARRGAIVGAIVGS